MGLHYRVPLPGLFYYSGHVGLKHWLPRSSRSGGVGPAVMVARSMVCSGWPVAGGGTVRGVGWSLFSGLCCSARFGLSWLGRAPFCLALLEADQNGCPLLKARWSLLSGWHRIRRFVMVRDGGCDRMRPVAFRLSWCSGGDVPTCRDQHTRSVMDVSPWVCGQAATGALELRPSGARQHPDGTAQTPCNITKTITKKEKRP